MYQNIFYPPFFSARFRTSIDFFFVPWLPEGIWLIKKVFANKTRIHKVLRILRKTRIHKVLRRLRKTGIDKVLRRLRKTESTKFYEDCVKRESTKFYKDFAKRQKVLLSYTTHIIDAVCTFHVYYFSFFKLSSFCAAGMPWSTC